MTARTVIVGGSVGCMRVAQALRRGGFADALTVVDADQVPAYDKPPMSKANLTCTADPHPAWLARDEGIAALGLDYLAGTTAVALDPRAQQLTLSTTEVPNYTQLVLATGSAPRRLEQLPAASNVHYLRTFDNATRLRTALRGARNLAVIGGGFIGAEVAASARALGVHVSVIEAGPRILARVCLKR